MWCGNVNAEYLYKEYRQNPSDYYEYLHGLGDGMGWSITFQDDIGPGFFCQPGNLAIGIKEYLETCAKNTIGQPPVAFMHLAGVDPEISALITAKHIINTITQYKPLTATCISLGGKIETEEQLKNFQDNGYQKLPICVAKTQYSFSTDPSLKGAPTGHVLPIREVRLSSGAEFIVVVCGAIMTMPGLPRVPAADSIRINEKGETEGLF